MGSAFDTYYRNYEKAEKSRKSGKADKAVDLYAKAMDFCEKLDDSIRSGLPPAPYRECAKMLYHLGHDEEALGVLDRHSQFERRQGRQPLESIVELRERLANGDMQRQAWRYQ